VKKVPKETMTITLEEPDDEIAIGKKKRPRRTVARVLGKPSMVDIDDDEEEEPTADAPPAKTQKLMSDAIRTAPSKSKPKTSAPKRSTINISATEKNKAPVHEADVDEEPLVLRKLKLKIPDHDNAHPVAENMMLRKDKGLCLWRLIDPYAARRRTAYDYRF
jgi:hypothetical protein